LLTELTDISTLFPYPTLFRFLNCFLTFSTLTSASSMISCFSERTTISDTPTVIPARDEYLNPKSFILSSIIEVSVIWNLLNISAMILPKNTLLNGLTSSTSSRYSTSPPSGKSVGETKYLSGVDFSKLKLVGSLIYGNELGIISLKITLPTEVINNFLFCSAVNVGFLSD